MLNRLKYHNNIKDYKDRPRTSHQQPPKYPPSSSKDHHYNYGYDYPPHDHLQKDDHSEALYLKKDKTQKKSNKDKTAADVAYSKRNTSAKD